MFTIGIYNSYTVGTLFIISVLVYVIEVTTRQCWREDGDTSTGEQHSHYVVTVVTL